MHPTGMLDRDQRTAKIPLYFSDNQVPKTTSFRDSSDSCSSSSNISSIISSRTTSSTKFLYLNWRKGYLIHSFQRLKNVLLVLVYLTLITLPPSSSAPTNARMGNQLSQENPRWINPCGFDEKEYTDSVSRLEDSDLKPNLMQISRQAGIALSKVDEFKDDFTRKLFNSNYDDQLFRDQNYDWLPSLPDLSSLEQSPLKIDETLLDAYEYLQKVAVGLEQVVLDQLDRPGHFPGKFVEHGNYLIAVLCEVQTAIIERNIKMRPDILRSIMPNSLRWNKGVTASNARDFIIFRSYRNTLEYVMKVFDHLASKL